MTPFFLIFLKDINLSSFLFTGKNGSFGLGFYSVIICYMFTLIWAIKMLLCDEKNDKLHSFCLAIIDLVVFISLFTFIKTSLWFVLFLFVCFITSIFTLILKNCSYNNTDTQDKIENN